eukprot:m.1637929 g.1637929  ORF g.1637929 m.1637929 type:complete len:130 (-) comp26377_c0_seq1:194-583(-)
MSLNAMQTAQTVLRVGKANTEVFLTHNRHIPLLMNTIKDVLTYSNKTGAIKAVFPGVKRQVRRHKRVFDVSVKKQVQNGFMLQAQQYHDYQELFVSSTLSREELQYLFDVAMGKYNFVSRKPEYEHLMD